MANRWGRNAPYGGGYMGSGVGFYMGGPPPDRRPYNPPPVVKPFYGGYREDNYNRRPERRDDFRGGKRGPPKARSPLDKRYQDSPAPRRDHRPFVKRQSLHGKYEVKVPRTPFNMPSKSLCEMRHAIRFMELKYYRTPGTKAAAFTGDEDERLITSEKPELVVFFLPNATHLIPTEEQWEKTKDHYSSILQGILAPDVKKEEADGSTEVVEGETSVVDASMEESEENVNRSDLEPTHYSKLDANLLKVNELRNELAARGLDTKGLKVNLVSRLQAALDQEKNDTVEESKVETDVKPEQPVKPTSPILQTEESKELSEKERRRLERLYRLADKPVIVIHPNGAARGGRFDCHRVSLFSLLDYRSDEPKEHNFEVSLFAEQFNEMLQRDCAFKIFKAVFNAPEKEHKLEQDVKGENGHVEECDESDSKRRRLDASETDSAEHKMRKLIAKVARRDHVDYRNLTDADIVEGDEHDVVSITADVDSSETDATLMAEKTRLKLNTFKDTEDELEAQNRDLNTKLKAEQKQLHEFKSLSSTYNHLLKFARDQMERAVFDINKQFDKEKAKREADKVPAEAEKLVADGDQQPTSEVTKK